MMNARSRIIVIGGVALLTLSAAFARVQSAQQRPAAQSTGSAQLGGVVTSTGAGRQPVRRVLVRISASELRGVRETVTDDSGRFLFSDLPAGRYTLTATKVGYLDTTYGARQWRGTGTPISLAEGQQELGIRLPLPRDGVIAGVVKDPFGVGTSSAIVQLLERTTVNGQATMILVGRSDVTDADGAYRIVGVPPGTFFVAVSNSQQLANPIRVTSATDLQWAAQPQPQGTGRAGGASAPPASQLMAFTPVLYPGVTDSSAARPVSIEAGGERLDVDIPLRLVPISRVSGSIARADGQPAFTPRVSLTPESASRRELSVVTRGLNATIAPPGEFSFASVEPGRYVLTVQASSTAPNPNAPRPSDVGGPIPGPMDLWARVIVDVSGQDVTGLSVLLQPALSISGRLVMERTVSPAVPNPLIVDIRATAEPPAIATPIPPRASAHENETFTINGLIPGPYLISVFVSPPLSGPAARPVWAVKSVQMQGRDVLDRFVDLAAGGRFDDVVVTLTDRIASLTGKLVDGQGKPAPEYVVIMLPVDRASWMQGMSREPRMTRPSSDGLYRFEAMPPGEYYVAAATDFQNRDLYTTSVLEQFIPSAIKITIAEGEKKVQDLKIGG